MKIYALVLALALALAIPLSTLRGERLWIGVAKLAARVNSDCTLHEDYSLVCGNPWR